MERNSSVNELAMWQQRPKDPKLLGVSRLRVRGTEADAYLHVDAGDPDYGFWIQLSPASVNEPRPDEESMISQELREQDSLTWALSFPQDFELSGEQWLATGSTAEDIGSLVVDQIHRGYQVSDYLSNVMPATSKYIDSLDERILCEIDEQISRAVARLG